jgi:hypothetical protein
MMSLAFLHFEELLNKFLMIFIAPVILLIGVLIILIKVFFKSKNK